MKQDDFSIMQTIRSILEKGNNCEVKKDKDGKIVIYEVKKKKYG